MSTQPKPRLTPEQYLAIERKAEFRSEFHDGEMFAMAGATEAHTLIAGNLHAALHGFLRGKNCRVYFGDLRIRAAAAKLYMYPDLSVVCGESKFAGDEFDVLLNPNLIAEVLSPSTEAYDRGRKFEHYRTIESLSQYLLIAQDRMHLDLFTKGREGWFVASFSNPLDRVELSSIGCSLSPGDLYENVDLNQG